VLSNRFRVNIWVSVSVSFWVSIRVGIRATVKVKAKVRLWLFYVYFVFAKPVAAGILAAI